MTEPPDELVTVKTEIDTKTPSQRLRAVLFVEYYQKAITEPFDLWYSKEMETIINARKALLEPET